MLVLSKLELNELILFFQQDVTYKTTINARLSKIGQIWGLHIKWEKFHCAYVRFLFLLFLIIFRSVLSKVVLCFTVSILISYRLTDSSSNSFKISDRICIDF